MNRYYIACEYKERNEVKKLGAKWDSAIKHWYYEADEPLDKFSKWEHLEDIKMRVACKEIKFDFTSMPDKYAIARETAIENLRSEYIENQEIEEMEILDAIDDGKIQDASEYKRKYALPFEQAVSQTEITAETEKVMRLALQIPQTIIFDISKEEFESSSIKSALAARITNKYHVPVLDMSKPMAATTTDVAQDMCYESIGKMIESDDYQTFLRLKENIRHYSYNNLAMVYTQCPDAQAVKGAKSWEDLGRKRIIGEKGITIWCPNVKELKTEEQVTEHLKDLPISDKERQRRFDKYIAEIDKKGKAEIFCGYSQGKVFDISQTEPVDPSKDNYDDILRLNKPLLGNVDNAAKVVDAINKVIKEDGVVVSCKGTDPEAIYEAVYKYCEKVMQEMPHSVSGIKSIHPSQGDLAKVEILVAAAGICEHIGVEGVSDKVNFAMTEIFDKNDPLSSVSAFRKAAQNGGNRTLFKNGFDRGTLLSAQFSKAFDKAYEPAKDKTKKIERG